MKVNMSKEKMILIGWILPTLGFIACEDGMYDSVEDSSMPNDEENNLVGTEDFDSDPESPVALYNGQPLRLKDGWGKAQSCVVYSKDVVECFDSNEEADESIGADSDDKMNSSSSGCPDCASGWLCLYQFTNGGGRRLIFRDESWQSLAPYDFKNRTSSWHNNQGNSDKGGLRFYLGGGKNENLTLSPKSCSNSMGSYDNRADEVHG